MYVYIVNAVVTKLWAERPWL